MRRLKSIVVSAVMAFAGIAAMASAQAATGPEYVALGDSYASGVGAGTYDSASGDCKRSPLDYPHQWAAANPEYTLKDVTCSGATIADVRNNQLSALSSTTNFVTLTVGGNDAQFATVAKACLTESDSYCKTATSWMSYYARNQLVTELAAHPVGPQCRPLEDEARSGGACGVAPDQLLDAGPQSLVVAEDGLDQLVDGEGRVVLGHVWRHLPVRRPPGPSRVPGQQVRRAVLEAEPLRHRPGDRGLAGVRRPADEHHPWSTHAGDPTLGNRTDSPGVFMGKGWCGTRRRAGIGVPARCDPNQDPVKAGAVVSPGSDTCGVG